MTYNPADYATVAIEAKGKSKEELERYYSDDKSKRHLYLCEIIGMIILLSGIAFFIGLVGYAIGEDDCRKHVKDNIEIVTEDICTLIEGEYKSPIIYDSEYSKYRIICD